MTYTQLMYLHLATVVPCFFIGIFLFSAKKGTPFHRKMGKLYMLLMLFTALVTIFMPAHVGPQLFNHFGWLHSFTLLTLITVPAAYQDARKGRIKNHKRKMLLLYVGAILIAGSFTFVPGRFLYRFFFE